jgi:alginate O-acetyltransferase complex protein AlgI
MVRWRWRRSSSASPSCSTNDFAGYTSIARGVSCLFGIELSRNFAQPFAAHSFTNFWNRWHITFSHWAARLLYLPLSRRCCAATSADGTSPTCFLPPIATMLVCGLWHGASAHMLAWGGLLGNLPGVERAGTLPGRRRRA